MYGIYEDIIAAAERATEDFEKTKELLEYPEVQADKEYYLFVLAKYNELNVRVELMNKLKQALKDEADLSELATLGVGREERDEIDEAISSLKRRASELSTALAMSIGCSGAVERAYCRFKLTKMSAKFGEQLYDDIRGHVIFNGGNVERENKEYFKDGGLKEISFYAEGEDVITSLGRLSGAHKVYMSGAKSEELCFAVTPAASYVDFSVDDLKIDVFHSHGAGGQNINKVETAVRVTHIPTGIVVTCQDERSQLRNRRRAIDTIKARLRDRCELAEKSRMDADINAQFNKKNTPISFDYGTSTMTDTRLKGYTAVKFPLKDFSSYINGLIAL